jgi:hypothetical protein
VTENDGRRGPNTTGWRAAFDAAIGPTPTVPGRLEALVARHARWRRRRAVAAGVAGFAAVALVGVGVSFAMVPGPANPPDIDVVISPSPTRTPTPIPSPPDGSPSPARSADQSAPLSTPPPPPPTTASASARTDAPALTGVVVDETGRALPHIYVTDLRGVTQTDANGRFVAPSSDNHNGGCLVFSSQPIGQPQRGAPAGGDYAWQIWEPPSGKCGEDAVADIRVVMRSGADVFGTVRDATGAPVAGVTVYSTVDADGGIWFMSSMCCHAVFSTVTDSQGRYRIYGQHAGHTTMSVRAPYYQDGMGALGYPANAGSGAPADLVDYGPDCNNAWPGPSCPNATPEAGATAAGLPTTSPPPTPSASSPPSTA